MESRVHAGKTSAEELVFSLDEVLFSRRFSWLSFGEKMLPTEAGESEHQLYLARLIRRIELSTQAQDPIFPGLFAVRPYLNGRSPDFATRVTPSLLTATCDKGCLEICFDKPDLVRVRGRGVGARLFAQLNENLQEAAVDRLDGTCQLTYESLGEFLFVPVRGQCILRSRWQWQICGTGTFLMDVVPDENGEFELAIRFAESDPLPCDAYRPFDECVSEVKEDFERWTRCFPEADPELDRTHRMAVYGLWICDVGPLGLVRKRVLLFEKNNNAFGWHSAYAAMAMSKDPDEATAMLLTIFSYQDEEGQLPDLVDDRYISMLCTKPPFQGVSVLYLMEKNGENWTREHCEKLYRPMEKWFGWWMNFRDSDRDGIPQYNQGCESGRDLTTMLAGGVPAECPDLITYLCLYTEAMRKMAERLELQTEAIEWNKKYRHLLDTLVHDFWNGRCFVARMSTTHEVIEPLGIVGYLPLLLGNRLPEEITNIICDTLEKRYLTEYGAVSLCREENTETYDYYLGFDQLAFSLGLTAAGKNDLAMKVVDGYLAENRKKLPRMGYVHGKKPDHQVLNTEVVYEDYGKCSSLSSAIFLIMEDLKQQLKGFSGEPIGSTDRAEGGVRE